MANEAINLDNVLLRVRDLADKTGKDVSLHSWLPNDRRSFARRGPADYNYNGFRIYLERSLKISRVVGLATTIWHEPIRDEHDFWALLARIQSGSLELTDGSNVVRLQPIEPNPPARETPVADPPVDDNSTTKTTPSTGTHFDVESPNIIGSTPKAGGKNRERSPARDPARDLA